MRVFVSGHFPPERSHTYILPEPPSLRDETAERDASAPSDPGRTAYSPTEPEAADHTASFVRPEH